MAAKFCAYAPSRVVTNAAMLERLLYRVRRRRAEIARLIRALESEDLALEREYEKARNLEG